MRRKNEKNSQTSLPHFGIPRLLPFLKPYKKLFVFMFIFGVMGSAVDIILPLFQKSAINSFIAEKTLDGLGFFILMYVLVLICQVIANTLSTFYAGRVELYVTRDLKNAAFTHLQTLSFSYFNQNSVGYIHARVMSDTGKIAELVSWSLMDAVWHFSYLAGAVAVMFVLNPLLALLVTAVVPFTALIISYFQKRLTVLNRRVREINSLITADFNEEITGAETIKTLVAEEYVKKRFVKNIDEMKHTSVRTMHFKALFVSTVSFASAVALALVLWRGGKLTAENAMLIGTLQVFMSYAIGLMEPIQWLVDAFSNLISVQVNIERLCRLLDTVSDVTDSKEVTAEYGDIFQAKRENWESITGDIEFCDVSFKYPDGDELVLEHFNMKIPHGTSVAIVGETGAGKSTLVNLVCRFYEPTSGKVLLDGKDLRERSQLWLHSSIGYVLQSPHLFSGSLRDNLRYGKPDATDEEIIGALKTVSAEELVNKLDKGLDSEVGEGGDLLSTGEKQLVSFARAIISDPRILILDEATSSIDTITEQKIQSSIKNVTNGRTSFIIAHRLSTIRDADIILVVKDGKIVEKGNHSQLMKAEGNYMHLYTRQFEEDTVNNLL